MSETLSISYFRCIAENAAGRAETKCSLTIKPPTKPPGSEDLVQPEVVKRAHAPPPKPDDVRTHLLEHRLILSLCILWNDADKPG